MKTYLWFLVIFIFCIVIWKFEGFSSDGVALSREILSFGDTENLTKSCLKEIQNLIEKSKKVPKLKKCQTLSRPAGDFERALKHLSIKSKSNCFSNRKKNKIIPENHLTYLESRQSDPALKWLLDRLNTIRPKFKRLNEFGNLQNGIIYLGLLDPAIQNAP